MNHFFFPFLENQGPIPPLQHTAGPHSAESLQDSIHGVGKAAIAGEGA